MLQFDCSKILMFDYPFPNKPLFLNVCSTSLMKTLREKEKLLVTCSSSFTHNIFYWFEDFSSVSIKFENCLKQTLSVWKSQFCCLGKGQAFPPYYTHFNTLKKKALGNHCGKK